MTTEPRYKISVWNDVEDEVVKHLPCATAAELDELESSYDNDVHRVVVDDEWEVTVDD